MRKITLALFTIFSMFHLYAQENYYIEINGKTFEVELNKEYEFKVDKELLKVKVNLNDTLVYDNDAFKFKYPKEYNVSTTTLEHGIEQSMVMTANGSGFIIQNYSNVNPTMMNEFMLNEVTKESISYGYEMERTDYERTLNSGQRLKVSKAILTYNDETNIYEISSIGKKDSGLVIMTMTMFLADSSPTTDKELIESIWNSLEIK